MVTAEVACFTNSLNHSGPEVSYEDLEAVMTSIPAYPRSELISESQKRQYPIFISKHYKVPVSYQELKRFYTDKLAGEGWHLEEETKFEDWGEDKGGRELIYTKGRYSLVITYSGEHANYAWSYAVNLNTGL
jgi:hypothetical protein